MLKLLTSDRSEWVAFEPTEATQESKAEADANTQRLKQFLSEILLAENSVFLTGLGTSLCVKKKDSPTERLFPTMPDLWKAASAIAGDALSEIRKKTSYPAGENIELLLSQCQMRQALKPDDTISDFVTKTEAMIVERCKCLNDAENLQTHELFLRKIVRRPTQKPRTKLFTTNYDLCFETAAATTKCLIVDGFSLSSPRLFDSGNFHIDFVRREPHREVPAYVENVVHLCKLHGSIDWFEQSDGQVVKGNRKSPPARHAIIYPREAKYAMSYQPPYLEMMARFQLTLRQPTVGLIVVGFGFNDAHIAQPLLAAIESNVSLKAIIVDPKLEELCLPNGNKYIARIAELIRAGDDRLTLFNAGFEDLVKWLPDPGPPTELQRHQERIAKKGIE